MLILIGTNSKKVARTKSDAQGREFGVSQKNKNQIPQNL